MEYDAGADFDYSDVVETLSRMFGNVISEDVILTVVESCGGNLNLAADAIMNISNDDVASTTTTETQNNMDEEQQSPENIPIPTTSNPLVSTSTPILTYKEEENSDNIIEPSTSGISYASTARSTGAVPKILPPKTVKPKEAYWTEQFQRIVNYHKEGSRVLVLMRGVPGSGKSYLARKLIDATVGSLLQDYKTHICSTDDYFMDRGMYVFDRQRLSEAHQWNHNRVRAALQQGFSPIIVDNTNIEIWEMEPYLRAGVENGYFIEVMEPNTPWAKKFNQLAKRNTHNVPTMTIRRMLDNFQDGITGEVLIRQYGLSYPPDMIPPVTRTVPAFYHSHTDISHKNANENLESNIQQDRLTNKHPSPDFCTEPTKVSSDRLLNFNQDDEITTMLEETDEKNDIEKHQKQKRFLEIQKQLEEFEIVDREWENGESWEETKDASQKNVNTGNNFIRVDPKPPRICSSEESTPRDNILETVVQSCDDWRQISMYMPPWSSANMSQENEIPEKKETKSTGTSMETEGDNERNAPNYFKIITTVPRDINLFYITPSKEKIPNKRTLDKSTMTTSDEILMETFRCKNEEKHFKAFRNLFKHVPKAALRDIFEKCRGDVNWAVDIVLNDMTYNQIQVLDNDADISDSGEEDDEQLACSAACSMPDTSDSNNACSNEEKNITEVSQHSISKKKTKSVPSAASVAVAEDIKRQIERNVVISDDHYSEHVLKIRRFRHGEYDPFEATMEQNEVSSQISDIAMASTIESQDIQNSVSKPDVPIDRFDDDVSSSSSVDELEKTVNINVGKEFLSQLDNLFGRMDMTYPDFVEPKINIPLSLLQEINAFWLESLMDQLDKHDKQDAKMIWEDEEFAKQLINKEAELAAQGREPDIPDFKEIMDMDLALSLYQKDVAEWKSRCPEDWATKLSRDKLYNLFPEMSKDILTELLMAHDNNFKDTVEGLLISTGRAEVLENENGLNKFIVQKEMERQAILLEEEKKNLSDVEWPLLPRGEKVAMSAVNQYREDAERHLVIRNKNYQKAQEYVRRGMTQVANYFNQVANLHKQKYEQANSMAAVTLMQIHAENCQDNATIDLHYLRVPEAKETLDLFLDTHINKLKGSRNKGPQYHTLFFITGRGLHSHGGPRVKPAVKRRLRERGLVVSERNPGLLTARVSADHKLSYQVQVP